jgi:hypothetical protein
MYGEKSVNMDDTEEDIRGYYETVFSALPRCS